VDVRFGKVQLEKSYRDNRLARTLWGERLTIVTVEEVSKHCGD
jgi:hypothetical protein